MSKFVQIFVIATILLGFFFNPSNIYAQLTNCDSTSLSITKNGDIYTIAPIENSGILADSIGTQLIISFSFGSNLGPRKVVYTTGYNDYNYAIFDPIQVSSSEFPAVGSYLVFLGNAGAPDMCQMDERLEITQVATGAALCGSLVGSVDQCPAECPGENFDFDRDGISEPYCSCGGFTNAEQRICCPAGNQLGLGQCNLGYCNPDTNLCSQDYGEPGKVPQLCLDGSFGYPSVFGCIKYNKTNSVVVTILRFVIPFVGGIALVFIAFSAFIFMTSSGDPKKIAMAKEILVSALAGTIVIVLSSWLLRVIGVDVLGLFS